MSEPDVFELRNIIPQKQKQSFKIIDKMVSTMSILSWESSEEKKLQKLLTQVPHVRESI
jgi:hypothetical protein